MQYECEMRFSKHQEVKFISLVIFFFVIASANETTASDLAEHRGNSGFTQQQNLKFTYLSEKGQTILKLAPTIENGGVNLSFWSSLSQSEGLRPLNIKAHGKSDFFDKSNHVSFYTTDVFGNQPKAFEWHWGEEYNAIVKFPTMGLDVMRVYNKATGSIVSPVGIKIRNPSITGASLERNIGLLIEEQSEGTKSNYSIFTEGGLTYLGGKTGINVEVPNHSLDVKGDSSFQGKIFYNGNELSNVSCSSFNFPSIGNNNSKLLMSIPYSIVITKSTIATYSDHNYQLSADIFTGKASEPIKIVRFGSNEKITLTRPVESLKSEYRLNPNQLIRLNLQIEEDSKVDVVISVCYRIIP